MVESGGWRLAPGRKPELNARRAAALETGGGAPGRGVGLTDQLRSRGPSQRGLQ